MGYYVLLSFHFGICENNTLLTHFRVISTYMNLYLQKQITSKLLWDFPSFNMAVLVNIDQYLNHYL